MWSSTSRPGNRFNRDGEGAGRGGRRDTVTVITQIQQLLTG